MKALVCVGNYASTPYYFEKLGIHVYCLEELCRCLKENAFLLGREIMNDGLIRFVELDCGVPELARELYSMAHQKGQLSTFVSMILEYVGLYDAGTVRQVEETLKRGTGLTDYEKQKLRIDSLVQKKKFSAAVEQYEDLIRYLSGEGEEVPGRQKLIAGLLHNQGVALANMMMYREAAECFYRAGQESGQREEYQFFLAAKRRELTENEYISYVAEMPEMYEASMLLERRMEHLEQEWHMTPEYNRITQMKFWRDRGEYARYRQENENIVQALKDSYRSCAGE